MGAWQEGKDKFLFALTLLGGLERIDVLSVQFCRSF